MSENQPPTETAEIGIDPDDSGDGYVLDLPDELTQEERQELESRTLVTFDAPENPVGHGSLAVDVGQLWNGKDYNAVVDLEIRTTAGTFTFQLPAELAAWYGTQITETAVDARRMVDAVADRYDDE